MLSAERRVAGGRVWSIFLELHATRTGGFAAHAISYAEIESYGRIYREPIRPFEVTMLHALDDAWLKASREKATPVAEQGVSPRPLTGPLFDALFAPG